MNLIRIQRYSTVKLDANNVNIKRISNNVSEICIHGNSSSSLVNRLPKSLHSLKFTGEFNGRLDLRKTPRLTNLEFWGKYDLPINYLPESLESLKLGENYLHALPRLPNRLRFLDLGKCYNHPLPKLPDNLEKLLLSVEYSHELKNRLPDKLKELRIGEKYNNQSGLSSKIIPKYLNELWLLNHYEIDYHGLNLTTMTIDTPNYWKFGTNFPDTLKYLTIYTDLNQSGQFVVPRTVTSLRTDGWSLHNLDIGENVKYLHLTNTHYEHRVPKTVKWLTTNCRDPNFYANLPTSIQSIVIPLSTYQWLKIDSNLECVVHKLTIIDDCCFGKFP